ncbi:hypothetical protein [Noviherbaspirillum sp. ST9]|uniref:hypothetical protein n=1 Tax=Noviherbaspirillum sp. ST9 TaxID=3401606 RepID=UPI003B589225
MFKTAASRSLDRDTVRRLAEEAGCNPLLLQEPNCTLNWLDAFAASIEARVREETLEAVDEALAEGVAIAMELKE